MSNIPLARSHIQDAINQLQGVNDEHAREALRSLFIGLSYMTRRKATRVAPTKSRKMTVKLRNEIEAFAHENPGSHLADIAQRFNVNPGRVSGVLSGQYDDLTD